MSPKRLRSRQATALQVLPLSILSGLCGSAASVFGKIASNPSTFQSFVDNETHVRLLAVAGVILANVAMWLFFANVLCKSRSSAVATGMNLASNFLASALAGRIIFGEHLSGQWFLGALMILTGTLLLSKSNK